MTDFAAMYDELGGPDVVALRPAELDDPRAGETLVDVRVAGLNPFDGKVRTGFLPSSEPFPRLIGQDFAGRIRAVGDGATYVDGSPVSVGDEVFGWTHGAMATAALAPAAQLVRRPPSLSAEVAGGLAVVALTAAAALDTIALGPEDRVLVGGAAGGVGIVYAQLALLRGAHVVGTASPRHHGFLREIGVIPIEYGTGQDVASRVSAPITVVFDMHGRDALDAGVQLGVPPERMGAIAAYAAGAELGVRTPGRFVRRAADLAAVAEHIISGRIVLPIAARFPFDAVADAFRALEAPHAPGKILLVRGSETA